MKSKSKAAVLSQKQIAQFAANCETKFAALAERFRKHSKTASKINEIANELLSILLTPRARVAIASETNGCGQKLLETTMSAVLYNRSTVHLHKAVCKVVAKILELDVGKVIDASAFHHVWSNMTLPLLAIVIGADALLFDALVDRCSDATAAVVAPRDNAAVSAVRHDNLPILGVLLKRFGKDHALWLHPQIVHCAARKDRADADIFNRDGDLAVRTHSVRGANLLHRISFR